jgi:hypothetical protein
LTRQFDITGQSGAQYRYKALEELKPVSPGGANYLFVSWSGDTAKIIHAGETDSLHRAVFDTWDEARVDHGATEIIARLNITGAVRRAEQADIVARHRPPMNPPPPAAKVKADRAEADDAKPADPARQAG